MLMARFCARVRKRADLPSVSMPDIYKHPTIRSLAASLADTRTDTKPTPASQPATPTALMAAGRARNTDTKPTPVRSQQLRRLSLSRRGGPAMVSGSVVSCLRGVAAPVPPRLPRPYRDRRCEGLRVGLGQPEPGSTSTCGRSSSGAAIFLGLCTLPILLKWVLIGRWKPQQIRVWSMAYFRFWFVKTLVQREPDGAVRRFAALRALPEGSGREGRARHRDPLASTCPCAPTCSASATVR